MKAMMVKFGVLHCSAAIGYIKDMQDLVARVCGQELTDENWDNYDRMSGEIPLPVGEYNQVCGGLFGGGIGFPQDLVDGGGNVEPWVGFKRSVEQVQLMVEAFRESKRAINS